MSRVPGLRESHRGDIKMNRVTGERVLVLVGTGDGHGDRLTFVLRVSPGGRLVREHFHPAIEERFRLLKGRLRARLDGREDVLDPGADVTIAPGVVHDWWNDGEDEAEVLVDVRPGRRFELMASTLFGLANDGRTSPRGVPSLLQLAVIAREFADVVRFTKPPFPIQRAMFGALAAIGRMRGYRPVYPEYLEPEGRQEPDRELLAIAGLRE
jgi:quercetin dioxygenase-like cupin family protein